MALKIKYPTLITSELESHFSRCDEMVSAVKNIIDNYNNIALADKFKISYRGKTKKKTIKYINTTE